MSDNHPWNSERRKEGAKGGNKLMYETITIEEAQARLAELIGKLNPGEEVVITEDDQPVARLTRQSAGQWPCQPGSAKNTSHWMAPDFDAPLDDSKMLLNGGNMTKEEALRFKQGWAAVNQIVIEEARGKTPEERLRDLGVLYRFGKMIGWPQLPQDDEGIVWELWRKLREKLGVTTDYVPINGFSN